MTHAAGDGVDCNSTFQTWNRTPGKPSLSSSSSGAVLSSWTTGTGKNNALPTKLISDPKCSDNLWSNSNTNVSHNKNSYVWPVHSENTEINAINSSEFSLNNWEAHSRNVSMGLNMNAGASEDTNDRMSGWSGLQDTPVIVPRAITGQQTRAVGAEEGFSPIREGKQFLRGEILRAGERPSFSTWVPQAHDDFTSFTDCSTAPSDYSNSTPCISEGGYSVNVSSEQAVVSEEEGKPANSMSEHEALLQRLINTTEAWGQKPIDQSTPWDLSELTAAEAAAMQPHSPAYSQQQTGLLGDAVAIAIKQQRIIKGYGLSKHTSGLLPSVVSPVESNVWPNEPPNGTGIWESYYEGIGERTARWKQNVVSTSGAAASPSLRQPRQPAASNPVIDSTNRGSIPNTVAAFLSGLVPNPAINSAGLMSSAPAPHQRSVLGTTNLAYLSQNRFNSQLAAQYGGRTAGLGMLGMPNSFRNLQTSSSTGSLHLNWQHSLHSESPGYEDSTSAYYNTPWGDTLQGSRAGMKGVVGGQMSSSSSNNNNNNCSVSRWCSGAEMSSLGSVWPLSEARRPSANSGGSSNSAMACLPHPSAGQHLMMPSVLDSTGPLHHQTTFGQQPQHQHYLSKPPPLPAACQRRTNASQHLRSHYISALLKLGFLEEAQALHVDPSLSLDRVLLDLRERTCHPALESLLASCLNDYGSYLNSEPCLDATRSQLMLRSHAFSKAPSLGKSLNQRAPPNSLVLNENTLQMLQTRESQILNAIMQLRSRHQELNARMPHLRKLSSTTAAVNPLILDMQSQIYQVNQQLEFQQHQLKQVRSQGAMWRNFGILPTTTTTTTTTFTSSGHPEEMTSTPAPYIREAVRFSNSSGFPISHRVTPSLPEPGLSARFADLKLSSPHIDVSRRQLCWDRNPWGKACSSVGGGSRFLEVAGLAVSSSEQQLEENLVRLPSLLSGDRRWTADSSLANLMEATAPSSYWSMDAAAAGCAEQLGDGCCCWLLVSDLVPHISLDTLKIAISTALTTCAEGQREAGLSLDFEIHPNMLSRWCLLCLPGQREASIVSGFISNNTGGRMRLGSTEVITSSEARSRLLEIKNLASQAEDDSSNLCWLTDETSSITAETGGIIQMARSTSDSTQADNAFGSIN